MRGPETQAEYKFASRCVSNFKYFYLAPSQRLLGMKKSTLVREEIAFLKPLIGVTLNLRMLKVVNALVSRLFAPTKCTKITRFPKHRSTYKGKGWRDSVAEKLSL